MKKKKEPESTEIQTLIGAGAKFEGELSFTGSVRIDGSFSGKIFSDEASLIVGSTGSVKGEINVSNLVVVGICNGNAKVLSLTRLLAGSSYEGEIETKDLIIEQGAVFNGSCKMEKKSHSLKK